MESTLSTQVQLTFKNLGTGRHAKLEHLLKLREWLPLLHYAAVNTLRHAEVAQQSGVSQASLLKSLEISGGILAPAYLRAHNVSEDRESKRYTSDLTLLYVVTEATLLNLLPVALASELCSVNTSCGRHGSALHAACATGNEELTRCLLAAGADDNANCGPYKSALGTASAFGHYNIVALLVERAPDRAWILENVPQRRLKTVLSKAVARFNIKVMRLLLEHGAPLKWQILIDVATFGWSEAVVLCLDHGARMQSQAERDLTTALKRASDLGNVYAVTRALSYYSPIDACAEDWYFSAICKASSRGDTAVVQTLSLFGALPSILPSRTHYGGGSSRWEPQQALRIMLRFVLYSGDAIMTRKLLDAGAPFDAGPQCPFNQLCVAAFFGRLDVVKLLLDHADDINAKVGYFGNALHTASYAGQQSTVVLLLDRGARINCPGPYGTAIQLALQKGHLGVVDTLASRSADTAVQCAGRWSVYRTQQMQQVRQYPYCNSLLDNEIEIAYHSAIVDDFRERFLVNSAQSTAHCSCVIRSTDGYEDDSKDFETIAATPLTAAALKILDRHEEPSSGIAKKSGGSDTSGSSTIRQV